MDIAGHHQATAGRIDRSQALQAFIAGHAGHAQIEEHEIDGTALDAEAQKNPAGQLDVKLGEVYFGAGEYREAVDSINRGLGKGQVGQPDEAYVSLGRSLTADKDPAAAKQAFAKLKSLPTISPRVLRLWNLYADMLPETVSEPR